jgi:hypothetical protein
MASAVPLRDRDHDICEKTTNQASFPDPLMEEKGIRLP